MGVYKNNRKNGKIQCVHCSEVEFDFLLNHRIIDFFCSFRPVRGNNPKFIIPGLLLMRKFKVSILNLYTSTCSEAKFSSNYDCYMTLI